MSTVLLILLTCSSVSILQQISCQQDKFTYNGFDDSNPNITLSNAAEIRDRIIHMTSYRTKTPGHVFHTSPFQFKSSTNGTVSSFSTCFAFRTVPSLESPFSTGGLTFAIAPSRDFSTAQGGGYHGLLNSTNNGNISNHILAVEFDTFRDKEFDDINDNHVGIDINSLISVQSAPARYTDPPFFYNRIYFVSGEPVYVWIDYDSVMTILTVTLSAYSSRPQTPLLYAKIDLSQVLLDSMYVGFTASTSDIWETSHYLLGWSFQMNGEATLDLDAHALPLLPPRNKHTRLTVSVSVAAFIILLASVFTTIYLVRRKKTEKSVESWELAIRPCRYSYLELKKATKIFSDTELLGRGGIGRVYQGTLPNTKTNVAVKRISHESKQGVREFVSEISTIVIGI